MTYLEELTEEKMINAAKELYEMLENDPKNSKAYYFLALIYLFKDRGKAIEILEFGIKNTPPQSDLCCLAGLTHFSLGNYERALELLLKTEELTPEPGIDLYKALGETYFKLNKYDEAAESYLKKVEDKVEYLDYFFYAADCYRLSLKWNAAEMVINRALKICPEDVRFHNLLAFLSIMRFNFQRAFQIYQKIMEIDEKYIPQALFNKGFAYLVMGNYEETLKIWAELTEKFPAREDFYYSLAFIHFTFRNKREALKYFKRCIETGQEGILSKKSKERIKEVEEFLN